MLRQGCVAMLVCRNHSFYSHLVWLPPFRPRCRETVEYKYVMSAENYLEWQPGENLVLAVEEGVQVGVQVGLLAT